ncbi:hypothetical protein BDA96_05G236800 [Sorghum bicolor]|uniref:Uncharacterized protein n=2 Tax=Sorghum bicolor TaxID=4558 RepID=A0A921R0X8_SORBI|nr:hypothetical protein BDA96_05G236800 [Sorghum bicolor]
MQIQSKRIEGVLGLVTMAYHVKKSTASLLPIAALVVTMAMFLSSCDATDYCHAIVPCSDETCFYYCQKNNYKNFQTYCTPGQYYPNCCCRVPDA